MGLTQNEKIIVRVDPDIQDLIPDFLKMRRDDIKSIQSALLKNDLRTIEILGHSMKGSGGGYGFDRISEIGGVLEIAAKNDNKEGIRKQTADLSNYLDRVEVVFE
ncbi:MAG: Hpt domain-containing protein [Nitrospinae bacterium]|nr:Hpt domain-containing protein [Nitrospinota bacterium]